MGDANDAGAEDEEEDDESEEYNSEYLSGSDNFKNVGEGLIDLNGEDGRNG